MSLLTWNHREEYINCPISALCGPRLRLHEEFRMVQHLRRTHDVVPMHEKTFTCEGLPRNNRKCTTMSYTAWMMDRHQVMRGHEGGEGGDGVWAARVERGEQWMRNVGWGRGGGR
ncbi:hypothetical protein GLAREA_04080 [Glarea lozoyensis ATCC 20868]|uniref:Uncharacterized protein n=1 Tax=Glarea lozoyensis (strain ATCC 20868 / MF5171) TaxID=1116229 RepID=S3DXM0_GLAL2|nr:uncharacterized protein GLAREA_04080 [Glarea lozoyensis ATCC 20868]EPE31113.1 hypothetical protein GLAREA_04080 [Glarea lozoyensis ATCC 20868]